MRALVIVRHQRVPIWGLPAEIDGLKIAHISDLHFRRWGPVYEQARELLVDLDYDLLAATGDFSPRPDRFRETADFCRRFFEALAPPLGSYAVLGNHDDRRLGSVADFPVRWLDDDSTLIHRAGGRLRLAGVRQHASGTGRIDRALAEVHAGEPVIMLAHYPSTVYVLPPGQVRLLLAGHTHGGQIRLPVIGAAFTNDRLPRAMARGLHLVGRTWLHVNPGLGVSAPIPARLLCPPEITVLELRRARPEISRAEPFGECGRSSVSGATGSSAPDGVRVPACHGVSTSGRVG